MARLSTPVHLLLQAPHKLACYYRVTNDSIFLEGPGQASCEEQQPIEYELVYHPFLKEVKSLHLMFTSEED